MSKVTWTSLEDLEGVLPGTLVRCKRPGKDGATLRDEGKVLRDHDEGGARHIALSSGRVISSGFGWEVTIPPQWPS